MKLRHRVSEGGSKPKPGIKNVKGHIRRSLRAKPVGENSSSNKKSSQSSTSQKDKSSRTKKNGLDDSQNDEEEDDESEDEDPPVEVCGLRDLIDTYNNETPEGKNLIDYECELKFECKACETFFLGLPEFIIHKARECMETVESTTNGELNPFLSKEVLVDLLEKFTGEGAENSDEEDDSF